MNTSNRGANSDGTFGMIATGNFGGKTTTYGYDLFYSPAAPPTCIDMIGTGPGGTNENVGDGFNGGGGFGGYQRAGRGGWPGGGGGSSSQGSFGVGANGLVIVEF